MTSVLWVVLALGLQAVPAATPSLTGRVTDTNGDPLPGVSVVVSSAESRSRQTTTTDREGQFRVAGLAPGTYDATFHAMNFAEVRRRHLTVSSATPVEVNVTLHVSLSAGVVVTGASTFKNLADLPDPAANLVGVAGAASEGAVTAKQIESRAIMRAGEVLESVPGVIISQHSGEGKANQYYLRGFNLDHGTDFFTRVAGLPVNLPTHAHGQGYSDVNFLIPELVSGVQFRKGPYFAEGGDFSAAGSVNVNYANTLARPIVSASAGQHGWGRILGAVAPRVGGGHLLAALEVTHNDGPWTMPDDYERVNAVLRFSRGTTQNGVSITGLAYRSSWRATDQVPVRAIESGRISRFGNVDSSDAGSTARYSIVGDYQRTTSNSMTRASAFASKYRLNLFSNFTYALEDPVFGDQFEQADRRWVSGGRVTHTRKTRWGAGHGEHTLGVEIRNDDIPVVGLYKTTDRLRRSTVRQDDVTQTSVGAFGESAMRWSPWFRTSAGLRVDTYRVSVRSNDSLNSGIARDTIVSPKGGLAIGPWKQTEIYVNAGRGFHSNDARGATISRDPISGAPTDPATPLVSATGAEVGFRTVAIPRVQSTVSIWRLDLASELVFVGDAGSTEAGRPSDRFGIEWSNYIRINQIWTADVDVSWSRGRFEDADPAGRFIPGGVGMVAAAGVTADTERGLFGSLRWRYFGPRPLIEDNSRRSKATSLVNGRVGFHLTRRAHLVLDVFNLLNSRTSDIDYFYTSRLPGEPPEGVDDIHTHPALPRSLRLVLRLQF